MERKARPSTARRSSRRAVRYERRSSRYPRREDNALQVFLFHQDVFVGTELYATSAPIVVGRHPNADLRLDADTISRHHFRFFWDDGAVWVEDLASGNGTYVNESPLHAPHRLGFRDTLRVGPFTLKVRTLSAEPPPPADPICALAVTRIEATRPMLDSVIVTESGPVHEDSDTELAERSPIPPAAEPAPRPPNVEARLRDLSALLAFESEPDPTADPATFAADLVAGLAANGALGDPTPPMRAPPRPRRATPDAVIPHQRMELGATPTFDVAPESSDPVANDDPSMERIPSSARLSALYDGALDDLLDDRSAATERDLHEPHAGSHHHGIEIGARVRGRLVSLAVIAHPEDEYVLGYRTPQGDIAPAHHHVGLRLIKMNDDRTVDLVFPNDVSGHLVRGRQTVSLQSLTEGRKYSCLRLDPGDVAAIHLGRGHEIVSYHLRFLRRPASVLRDLKKTSRS